MSRLTEACSPSSRRGSRSSSLGLGTCRTEARARACVHACMRVLVYVPTVTVAEAINPEDRRARPLLRHAK